ncbi:hypothetical protein [Tardiphaga sp.]|uniref:hypothetical protein n=1 Tax=Tardiphaga sp. TaxID=1926292 RepID=UPI0037DA5E80
MAATILPLAFDAMVEIAEMNMPVLADTPRGSRRSVAGALDVLEKKAGFTASDIARVKTYSLMPDSGISASIVSLVFRPLQGNLVSVPLVTASHFHGKRPGSSVAEKRAIHELSNAMVGSDGRVLLQSLQVMRAITIDPAPLLGEPSELDRKIVLFVLSSIPNIEFFYRSPYATLSADQQAHPPQIRWLDWSMLIPFVRSKDSTVPPLKVLCYDFNQKYECSVSPETIRKAMMRCGLWQPRRASPTRAS